MKIPANKRTSAMNILERFESNGEEVDFNLIKSILNLNDNTGSSLNRVSYYFLLK